MDVSRRRRPRDKAGKTARWSEQLSPEAKIAMELAIEDTKALKLEEKQREQSSQQPRSPTRVFFADDKSANHAKSSSASAAAGEATSERQLSFSELYERNGSARMRRDLTDDQYNEHAEPRQALGGGKVESAMEIVEIVNHDEPADAALDEKAIEELARINSVDKCAVWIEATQEHHQGETAGPDTAKRTGDLKDES